MCTPPHPPQPGPGVTGKCRCRSKVASSASLQLTQPHISAPPTMGKAEQQASTTLSDIYTPSDIRYIASYANIGENQYFESLQVYKKDFVK